MFPVPEGCYTYVDFSKERNQQYKKLLITKYRIILKLQDKIKKMQQNYINKKFRMEIKQHLQKDVGKASKLAGKAGRV